MKGKTNKQKLHSGTTCDPSLGTLPHLSPSSPLPEEVRYNVFRIPLDSCIPILWHSSRCLALSLLDTCLLPLEIKRFIYFTAMASQCLGKVCGMEE